VSAELRDGVDALDVLAATFPAGTGRAPPKVRAMELIAELEAGPGVCTPGRRLPGFDATSTPASHPYLVFHDGTRHPAGGAIVADSDPGREYEETLHKAKALRRALEVAAAGLAPEG